jgi:hypothetical protein
MSNKNSDMSPIGFIFFIITFSPFLYLRYGENFGKIFIFLLPIFFIVVVISLYLHYHKKSTKNSSSFFTEIEKDLPDMSPIHIFFFLLVTTPIWFFIIGGKLEYMYGMATLFILHTIYYYGFRKR